MCFKSSTSSWQLNYQVKVFAWLFNMLELTMNFLFVESLIFNHYFFQAQQGRIACLYFPIVSVLLENVKRLSWPPAPSSISSSQRRLDPRASSRARSGRYVATFTIIVYIYVCYLYLEHKSMRHWQYSCAYHKRQQVFKTVSSGE